MGAQADGLQAAVGSGDPAAVPQELGTAHRPVRPFLAPAAAMGEEAAWAVGAWVAALRGDSPGAGAAGEPFLDAIRVGATATDAGLAILGALGAVALGLALKGQPSSPGLPTTSAPTTLEAALPVLPPVEGETPAGVLKPGG